MLRKIKFELNKTVSQIAELLNVTPPTLYNWDKNNSWPLWALEKCGVMDDKNEQKINKIKELLNEY